MKTLTPHELIEAGQDSLQHLEAVSRGEALFSIRSDSQLFDDLLMFTPEFLSFLEETLKGRDRGKAISRRIYMKLIRTNIREAFQVNLENILASLEIEFRTGDLIVQLLKQFGLILQRLFALHPKFQQNTPANHRSLAEPEPPAPLPELSASLAQRVMLVLFILQESECVPDARDYDRWQDELERAALARLRSKQRKRRRRR